MTTPPKLGYLMQWTPKLTDWHFSGDPKITGGQSWCDVKVNPDGSVTASPKGPYAAVYFWADHSAPPVCSFWASRYKVAVSDYGPIQAIEYDGQIQVNDWLFNFGLQLDQKGTKKARFFQYHPGHWDAFGDINPADFTNGKPVEMAAAFSVNMAVNTITLLGLTTGNAEYKPMLTHPAYSKQMVEKWTQGGQIDFDASGKGATFTIGENSVVIC